MAAQPRGLGKGLEALLKNYDEADARSMEVQMMSVGSIKPNNRQPRESFDEQSMAELADSIRSQGVLQPILVRPVEDASGDRSYQIVAGERRWRAAGMAGLDEVPVIIKTLNDAESMAIALVENLQREDLNPIEQARAFASLQDQFNLTQEDLALKLGKSRSAVANSLRLLNLSPAIQADIKHGLISAGHARAILAVSDEKARETLRKRILDQGLSVREAESQALYFKEHGSLPPTGPAQATKRKKNKTATNIDETLADFQSAMAQRLNMKVRLSGSREKGSVTVRYKNEQELKNLLTAMGIEYR